MGAHGSRKRLVFGMSMSILNKVGRGNLERNTFLGFLNQMGAVRETLWGVVGGKSMHFLVGSCRVPGSNLTGSSYGDSA